MKLLKINKPVVDVARDAQCCVHTRDSSCRRQTHRHCASRANNIDTV